MSVEAINWVLGGQREPGLRGPKGAQRLVLLVLANYASHDGLAFPGIDRIARAANISRDTATDALKALIDGGYLTREIRSHVPPGAKQARNVYRIMWDAERGETTPSPDPAEGVIYPDRRGCSTPAGGGDLHPAHGSTPIASNPIEPKGEPVDASSADALGAGHLDLTPGQRAAALRARYWDWAVATYRRAPDINPVGFQQIVAGLIRDGVDERRIGFAVKVLHEGGRPITRATIGAEIDGRGRRGRPTVAESLDTLRFDDNGNVVG